MTNGQKKKQNRIVEEREARVAENERNDKIARDNSAKKYAAANDAAAQFNSETKDVFYQKHSAEDLAAAHAAKAQTSAYVHTADAAKRARDNLILGMNGRDGLGSTAYISPEEQKKQRDNLNTYNMYMRRLRNMGYDTGSDPLSSTVRSALDTRAKYDTPDAWDQFTRTNEANAMLERYTSGLDAEGMRADVDTMTPYVDTAKRLKDFAEHTRDFAVATNGKGLDPTNVQGYEDFRQYLIGNGTITENSSPEDVLNAAAQFVDRYSSNSANLGVYDRYMQTKTMRDDAVSDPEFDAISQAWDGRGIESWWETTEYADDWGENKAFYTEEERRIYAYYKEKERRGEVEKGTAEAYKKSIAEAYNTREALGLYGEVQGSPVAELIFKGAAGLDQWLQGKIGEVDMLTGHEARPVSAVQLASGMVQEDLGKIGDDKLLGKKGLHGETIGQNLGDVIQTVGNMVPSMMVSAIAGNILPTYGLNDKWTKHLSELAGAVTLGSSAAGNAYQEMLRNGYTRQQAVTYGVLTGASETAMQYLIGGISFMGGQVAQTAGAKTLQQIASGFTKAATRAVVENGGKFLLNMLSEGTEELVQDILEPFFMAWATGQIREDVDWEDAMYSFALGALTAAGMDGTTNTINTLRLGKNFVAERVRSGDLQGVIDALRMFDGDTIAGQIGAEYANADASKLGVRDYANLFTGYKNAVSESTASEQTTSEISEMLRQRGVHSWIADDVAGEIANGGTYSSRMRSMMEADPTLMEAVVSVENALVDANTATNRRLTALSNIGRKESKQTTVGIEGYLNKLAEADKERDAFANEQMKRDLAGVAANLGGARSVNEALLRAGAQRQTSAAVDADVASAIENINAEKMIAPAAYSPSAFTRDNVKADSTNAPVRFEKSMKGGVNVVMANGNRTDIRSSVFQSDAQASVYGTLADGIEDGTISVNTANAILNAVDFTAANPSVQAARMAMIASHTGSGVEIAPEIMASYRGDVLTRRQASFAEKLGKDNFKATRKAAQDYALDETEAKPAEPAKRETKRSEKDRISREDAAWEEKMRGRGVIISAPRSTLTNRQLYSVEAVGRVCADVTGGKVIFFESVVDPKTGARVFSADVEGTKYKAGDTAPNGEYMLRDGTILLDLNAGDYGTGTILYTFAHELTHFVRDWNKDRYAALEQFVLDEYKSGNVDVDALIEAQIAKAAAQGEELTRDGAMEEVIADSMQEMFTAGDVLERIERLKNKDRTLWEKIRDKISELSNRIKEVYKRLNPDSAEAKKLKQIGADIDKLAQVFAESVVEAGELYQQNGADGVMTDRSGEATYVSSVRTVLGKAQRDAAKKKLMARFPEMTETDVDAWLDAETSLAKIILEPERVDYLDYLPGSGEIAIKKNSDYPQGTVDFSNICPKRRRVSEIMSQVFKQFPNQIFQPDQLSQILNIMKSRELVTPCMICYVEDRRQRDSIVADLFVRSLEAYRKGEKSLDGKKDFNDGQIKAFNMVGTDGYTPDIGELVTPEGMRELGEKHPGILNAWKRFNNARGMAAVRLLLPEAEYKREIRSYAPRTVTSKNNKGGLRFYSFSDFEIIHLLDIVQALTDCAEVGLFAQGYTKVNEYARLVKDTGMKLNRSLIPKGVLGYHVDENGKKVLDFDSVEGINCTDPNFFSDYAENPNIGNIVIGVNRDQILTAMLDPRIDQIIPFHTGQSDKVLKIKGIDQWVNYKNSQTDQVLVTDEDGVQRWKAADKQINIYTEVLNVLKKQIGEENINKRNFVEKYLEVCRERGYMPRFAEFLNQDADGNYVYTEGYHKMLVDFKTFTQDEAGTYLPQGQITPRFDVGYATQLLKDHSDLRLKEDNAFRAQVPGIVDEITEKVIGNAPRSKKSTRGGIAMYSPSDFEDRESQILRLEKDIKALEDETTVPFTDEKTIRGKRSELLQKRQQLKALEAAERRDSVKTSYQDVLSNLDRYRYIDLRSIAYQIWAGADVDEIEGLDADTLRAEIRETIEGIRDSFNEEGNASDFANAKYGLYVRPANQGTIVQYGDVSYSLRNQDPFGARAVLSSALESAAKTDAERQLLARYQDMAIDLDVWQGAVASLRREIHDLSFAEGARDTERITAMRNEVDRLVKQISVADKTLLNLEASAPLKRLLENETARARKLERERGRAVLLAEQNAQRERRESELDALREKKDAQIEKLRQQQTEKYERDMQELRDRKDAQIERIRQKRDEKIRAEIEKRIEMRTRERERRAATETRNKIKQRLNSIRKDLLEGRGNKAIPQGFVNGLIDMIDAIDPTGRKQDSQEAQRWRTGREMLADLRRVYEGLNPLDRNASADPDLKSLVENDPEFLEDIRYIAENFSDKPLRDLSLPDLETLYETIKRVWTRVRDAKRLIGATERATADQSRTLVSGEMQRMEKIKIGKSKVQTIARNTFSNPMRMVREMTGYRADSEMNRLFTEIRNGWMKGEEFKMRAGKKMDEVRTSKADRKALRDAGKGTVEMTDTDGNTFKASLLQVMQYLLTYERTISNPNAEHLQYGSWFADVDSLRKGKRNEAVEKAHQVSAPDAQLLNRLYKLVNDNAWAVRFMENARYVLQQMSTEEINATSMILEGVPIARDNAYIPYRVMPEWVDRGTTNDKTQASVRNIGFTKRLIPSAKTPLLFEGLDLILQQHVDEVAKYVGLAVPIRNWNTVMYYGQRNDDIPVSKRVTDAWGAKSWQALNKAVADIQGRRQNNVPAWVSKVRSAWVFATLASNVSVTIKQAASYPTAGAYLSLGALRHGVNAYIAHPKSHQAIYDRMDAITAEGYMRRRGWTTQEFGDMPNGIQKVFNAVDRKLGQFSPFNWIQSVDVNTTTALFLACEYEVEHKMKIGKNDPRYRDALKNLYETVIENTQPMYDPVHQTEVSRSPFYNKFIVFQTQPLQNSGILRDATQRLRFAREIDGKGSDAYRAAKKQFGSALSSQIMTSIVFVAMTMAAKLLRHKSKDYEDDEGKLTAASIFSQLGVDAGMNLFSAIFPVVGNYATQIAQWVVNGRGDALLSDPTLDAVNEALDAFVNEFTNARKAITGDAEYDLNKLKKFLVQMASFAGIPLGNAWNLAEGVALHVQDAVNGQFGSFEAGSEQTTAQADKALYNAIIAGDKDKVDKAFKGSKSADAWHTKLRQILRDNDPRVAQMVQAYFQKDYKAQKKLRNAIKADGKFIFEDIRAAELSEMTYLGNQIEKAQDAYAAGDERTYEKTMAALEERGYDRAFLDEMFGDVEFASETGPWWENGEDETTPDAGVSQYRESDVAAIVLDGTASDRQMMYDDLVAYHMALGDSREDAVETTQSTFRNAALALYKDRQYTISQVEHVYEMYGGYSGDDLYWKIEEVKGKWSWDSDGNPVQNTYSMYDPLTKAYSSGSDVATLLDNYTSHGKKASSVASAITERFKPLWVAAVKSGDKQEQTRLLSFLKTAYTHLGYKWDDRHKKIMSTKKNGWLYEGD